MNLIGNVCLSSALNLALLHGLSSVATTSSINNQSSAPNEAAICQAEEYRIVRYVPDVQLHTCWAILADARHLEAPLRILEARIGMELNHPAVAQNAVNTSISMRTVPTTKAAPVVRAGDRVIIWSLQRNALLHVEGIALTQGEVGEIITARTSFSAAKLKGTIRAPGSIELISSMEPNSESMR